MIVDKFSKVTIVTANRGSYLKLKGVEDSEELIGRPARIVLDNSGKVPEFEEVKLVETPETEEKVEEASAKKTTRKSTKKK